ncbi:MAG: TrmH family RNA methyltransferase [Anaerolineae bacterium]|jgi:TrmH family RNA methyltransferase
MKEDSPVITSTRNRRIVEARKLDQRKHRQRQGRFLVEGLQILHMALDAAQAAAQAAAKVARTHPLEVFYCKDLFVGTEAPTLLERFRQTDAELVPVAEHVMESLSERDAPQGIVATFTLSEAPFEKLWLHGDGLVVVLDRLQDPGNLGTLIRTADAVGAAAVILIEPCVDPFDPKTVRGSMGSLFNLPLARTSDVPVLFDRLRSHGLRSVGADAHQGRAWWQDLWKGGVALILGNEAQGLSEDVRPHVEEWARLPIVGKAESLNVAIAGGVLMYEWLRANLDKNVQE